MDVDIRPATPAANSGPGSSGTTKEGEVFVDDMTPLVIVPPGATPPGTPPDPTTTMADPTNKALLFGVLFAGGAALYLSSRGAKR